MTNTNENSIHPKDIVYPLLSNKLLVAIVFFSVVFTVTYLTFTTVPQYESTAIISIQEIGEFQEQLFRTSSDFSQKYLLKNQVAILKSRNLAEKLIERLRNSGKSDSLIILGNKSIQSVPSLKEKIFSIFKKAPLKSTKPGLYKIIENFHSSSKISYSRESNIINLSVRSPSPEEAALIANEWVFSYQDYKYSNDNGAMSQTRQFLEDKLGEIENKLDTAQNRLTAFKKKENVVSLDSETNQIVSQLTAFESSFNQSQTELEAVESQLHYLREQLDATKQNMLDNMVDHSNPLITQLQNSLAEIVTEKAAYEAQLIGEGLDSKYDRRLVQMENRIEGIKKKIIEETNKLLEKDLKNIDPLDQSKKIMSQILELETTKEALIAKTQSLYLIINDYKDKLESLPDKSRRLADLNRDVEVSNNLYVMLKEKIEEVRIQEASQLGFIRILDRAIPAVYPVFPKKKLNILIAIFFGFVLGYALAFIKEYLKGSIKSESDVTHLGIRVLGRIPVEKKSHLQSNLKGFNKNIHIQRARNIFPYIILNGKSYSPVAEAYRAVRTSLFANGNQHKLKSILITSPGESEGKSTTAINLAITCAQKGMRTLLIDSDLRKPVLDILLMGSKRKVGLSNFLENESKWHEIIRPTAQKRLYLVSAGMVVHNTSELLGSNRMGAFIERVKEEFDVVLLDSPPVLPVTDAALLSSISDGVVLVIKIGLTSREGLRRSLDTLHGVNATVLGTVLTGLDKHNIYGYHHYYHAYSEEDDGEYSSV